MQELCGTRLGAGAQMRQQVTAAADIEDALARLASLPDRLFDPVFGPMWGRDLAGLRR